MRRRGLIVALALVLLALACDGEPGWRVTQAWVECPGGASTCDKDEASYYWRLCRTYSDGGWECQDLSVVAADYLTYGVGAICAIPRFAEHNQPANLNCTKARG